MRKRSLVAKSTTSVFRKLIEGLVLHQSDVGKIAWRANHGRQSPTQKVYSYWHGSLEYHVEQGRIRKMITKKHGTTYKITKTGKNFAKRMQIM